MPGDAGDASSSTCSSDKPSPGDKHDTSLAGPGSSLDGGGTSSSRRFEWHPHETGLLGAVHLPSPSLSPSPSPRSFSPSVVVTEKSHASLAGTLNTQHRGSSSVKVHVSLPPIRVVDENVATVTSISTPVAQAVLPSESPAIISEHVVQRRKSSSLTDKVLKLSPNEIQALTSSPASLPQSLPQSIAVTPQTHERLRSSSDGPSPRPDLAKNISRKTVASGTSVNALGIRHGELPTASVDVISPHAPRRPGVARMLTVQPGPVVQRASHRRSASFQTSPPRRKAVGSGFHPEPVDSEPAHKGHHGPGRSPMPKRTPSLPHDIPLPPTSIPTYLQLELADSKPSPLYIFRPVSASRPYESSAIKLERLLNFLLLPPHLEQVLNFGSLVCLDAWLYTFTILPLRFCKAAFILISWWGQLLSKETHFILDFIYHGSRRMWSRRRSSITVLQNASQKGRPPLSSTSPFQPHPGRQPEAMTSQAFEQSRQAKDCWSQRHRRIKSQPSSLTSNHKADLLQGLVIICSCIILKDLDASRMYHNIKAQSTIKLYVIYNGLEVFDKLLAALGQDIFECLFSEEILERAMDGRSKVLRPLGMFLLALVYNVIHASALFYQVITLNVAVNSYSNALLTLLLSNQFVEIKSTVFKRIEKENLFQMTCADVIERFQLWLMLIIIGLRNIVEVGGLSLVANGHERVSEARNTTKASSLLPNSFTILPSWSGEVLTPFLIVLGSEMLVDSIKHAYVSKFNNVKPAIYLRYLDVLAKDYYTNAFHSPLPLLKRLGLPTIPLSCLFIRASLQTYHMFIATHFSPPPSPSPAHSTSLSDPSMSASATTTAALERFDRIMRRALGGDGNVYASASNSRAVQWLFPWRSEDVVAMLTVVLLFVGVWLLLLAGKLLLGMGLLGFSRWRYKDIIRREVEKEVEREREKERQRDRNSLERKSVTIAKEATGAEKETEKERKPPETYDTGGRRIGGWGSVEIDDDKRKLIYDDDPEGLRRVRDREKGIERAARGVGGGGGWNGLARDVDFERVRRYDMVGKRIW